MNKSLYSVGLLHPLQGSFLPLNLLLVSFLFIFYSLVVPSLASITQHSFSTTSHNPALPSINLYPAPQLQLKRPLPSDQYQQLSFSKRHILPHTLTLRSSNKSVSQWNQIKTVRTNVAELGGSISALGMFYAEISLGNELFHVQVDTGSATLAVPVDKCIDCKEGDRRYTTNKGDSIVSCSDKEFCSSGGMCARGMCAKCSAHGGCCSKFDDTKCYFQLAYADGSGASGALVHDTITIAGLQSEVVFGGIFHDSTDFERQNVDGIIGLSPATHACHPTCSTSVLNALVKKNGIDDMFAICMTPTSGKLVLGGVEMSMVLEEVTYFGYKSSSYYDVKLGPKMYLNEHEIEVTATTTIVDSGTTLLVVPSKMFKSIQSVFHSEYCSVLGLCKEKKEWFNSGGCFRKQGFPMDQLPDLKLNLLDFTNSSVTYELKLEPRVYMLDYAVDGEDYLCVGIQAMDFRNEVILGNTIMLKYTTVYDRANKRVGFAKSAPDCGQGIKF
mmetsp:Transcript_8564/g.15493  ORF Transcript_8564/g.15493 Transcript_8564/m.15493 type:complete len:499 (-) Transcript_8564:254-1750(-)|eukprot:CAMPEP_0182447476 /NCGR_PEP_ID=MMETSP1172-20130603/16419_1 /TAXON_ID=708627 /ORGANISM="Timspurckia oligopyrenoides, Strain CCMP3278" /LENGTH=498 /DNA_ID=CAMNT_0024643923 /DNA_START=72 /DNA_END=1568 /DNA_ORIENTATION=+